MNAGGSLILHVNPALTYTSDHNGYCGQSGLNDRQEATVTVIADTTQARVIHVVAAFPENSSPRLKAISFGMTYNAARFGLVDHGHCADFELAQTDWPDSGSGTALSWSEVRTGELIEAYWFAGYSYTTASHSMTLIPHPQHGGVFVDDSVPPIEDAIADYGRIGFGTYGYLPAAEDAEAEPHELSVYLSAGLIYPDHSSAAVRPVEGMLVQPSSVLDTLYACGAATIRKSFAGMTLADTAGYNPRGEPVTLPDLSYYFRVTFPTKAQAERAEAGLWACQGVGHAEVVVDSAEAYGDPDDYWYQDQPGYTPDPQWYLKNDGLRVGAYHCDDAVTGMDVGVSSLPYWYTAMGNPDVVIGIVDGGVNSQHEDLREVIQFGPHAQNDIDYCGNHGTKMAGLSAALTNNDGVGVAGVCPDCSVADVALIRPGTTTCDHDDENEISVSLAPAYMLEAADWSRNHPQYDLAAFSISVPISSWRECTDVLWRAYLQDGIVPCAATGNEPKEARYENWRCALPFVIGVGGHTWTGEFWDVPTTCYPPENSGVILGTMVGKLNVDICAPSCGSNLTVYPVEMYGIPYAYSRMMTSGATASVSGAIGLLRSYWRDTYPDMPPPRPSYLAGFLTGSALDFPVDPTTYPDRKCSTCPREDYGPGRLNVTGALALMDIHRDPAPGRYLVQGDLDYYDVASFVELLEFTYRDTVVRVTEVTWNVTVPPTPTELEGVLPPYLAFIVPEDCRVYQGLPEAGELQWSYPPGHESWKAMNLHQARKGIYGCRLSHFDAEGNAQVKGWIYRYRVPGTTTFVPIGVDRDHVKVAYAYLSPTPLDAPFRSEETHLRLRCNSPSAAPLRFELAGLRGGGALIVADATGRLVWSTELRPDTPFVTWTGTDMSGQRAPAGVYFIRARSGTESAYGKIALVR